MEGPLSPAFLTLQLPSCTHTYLSLPCSAVPPCTRRNAHVHTVPPPLCNLTDQGSQRAHQVLHGPKMETEAPPGEELIQDLRHLGSNSCTSACKASALQMGKLRPRQVSDLPKVTQRAGCRDRSGWGTFETSQTRGPLQSPRGSPGHIPPGEWRVRRHPGLTARPASAGTGKEVRHPLPQDPARLGRGNPAGPGASRRRPLAGTCCSPGLTQSPAATDGPAGRLHPGSVSAGCLAGCHTAGPPSARYAPSRVRPARVRHYAIPRPGTQPHPTSGSDWLSAPPA